MDTKKYIFIYGKIFKLSIAVCVFHWSLKFYQQAIVVVVTSSEQLSVLGIHVFLLV